MLLQETGTLGRECKSMAEELRSYMMGTFTFRMPKTVGCTKSKKERCLDPLYQVDLNVIDLTIPSNSPKAQRAPPIDLLIFLYTRSGPHSSCRFSRIIQMILLKPSEPPSASSTPLRNPSPSSRVFRKLTFSLPQSSIAP